LQRLWFEERRRGGPYSRDERCQRLEPVAETIAHHRRRNAAARASATKSKLARLSNLGHPPDSLVNCWKQTCAL
jgi:hypothetical protein